MKLFRWTSTPSPTHNSDETLKRLEELEQKVLEERQLARLARSEFLDRLFQGVIDDVREARD